MGYQSGLEREIKRYEYYNILKEEPYILIYEPGNGELSEEEIKEKVEFYKYDKEDILRAINAYSNELYGENLIRFIKAIKYYIEDYDIITELFEIDGKEVLYAISKATDLLENERDSVWVYNCAIDGSNEKISKLEKKVEKEQAWIEEIKSKKSKALGEKCLSEEEKINELKKIMNQNITVDKLIELFKKAKLWDEMQSKKESEDYSYSNQDYDGDGDYDDSDHDDDGDYDDGDYDL